MNEEQRKVLHSFQGENYIEVVEHGEFRSLYFQNAVVQSRIYHAAPGKLALRYTQYMMAASLLANPNPARILLIGVGAGALLHFFNHYLQEAQVDGVDSSNHILKIARGFFSVPENERVRIHCDDGLNYLATLENGESYDLILVDAFNDQGMAVNIYSPEFFKLARRRLTENGIICCNLWSGNKKAFDRVKKAIYKNSVSRIYIPVRRRENVIALLFQSSLPWKSLCPPKEDLAGMSRKYDFNFKEVSTAARKHNMRLGEQVQLWFS